jgi:hypothetical protein
MRKQPAALKRLRSEAAGGEVDVIAHGVGKSTKAARLLARRGVIVNPHAGQIGAQLRGHFPSNIRIERVARPGKMLRTGYRLRVLSTLAGRLPEQRLHCLIAGGRLQIEQLMTRRVDDVSRALARAFRYAGSRLSLRKLPARASRRPRPKLHTL